MKVGILIYRHCSLWSATGPMEILQRANKTKEYYRKDYKNNTTFDVEFICSEEKGIDTSFPFSVTVKNTIFNHGSFDMILIPGFNSNPEQVIRHTKEASGWLREQYLNGTMLASICTGSVLLAASGILNGKTATTHWMLKEYFEARFPEVRLDVGKVLIDKDNLLICGSATSFHNLMVYIIEKFMGRTIAVAVSKIYVLDTNKYYLNSYANLLPLKRHSDEDILKAQKFIEENHCKKISLEQIASYLSLSKRTFLRRFKNATNETPLSYIHKVKIEKAKEMLEMDRTTFEEISFSLGYEDVNAFRKIFVRLTGISPTKYKAKFQF